MHVAPYELKKDAVYREMLRRFESSEYTPGMRLPTERKLAELLGVSIITLRPALQRLEEEGRLIRMRSKGTFVAKPQSSNKVLVLMMNYLSLDPSAPGEYIYPGIEAELAKRDLEPEIAYCSDLRALGVQRALELLQQTRWRGALLLLSCISNCDPELELIRSLKIPYCVVHPNDEDLKLNIPCVYTGHHKAWEFGLEYLKRKNFKRIGIIVRPGGNRGTGPWPRELYAEAMYSEKELIAAAEHLLENKADVIYCYSDFYAIMVMKYLREIKKMDIPGDIAVMGYCGYPGRRFLRPALSTIDLRYREIGTEAVRFICSEQSCFEENAPLFPNIEIPFVLDEQCSTGKPLEKQELKDLCSKFGLFSN